MDKTCVECHPECERMDGNTTCSAPVCAPKLFFFLGPLWSLFWNELSSGLKMVHNSP